MVQMNFLRLIKNKVLENFPAKGIPGTKDIICDPEYHCHVGYYDFDPINSNNQIVYHKTHKRFTKNITPDFAEIMISPIDETQKVTPISIAHTQACNWQLGSRVHWYDSDKLMFNDIDKNGKQISKILDINNQEVTEIFDLPFWQTSWDRSLAASLNFQRLKYKRPGYGYNGSNKYGNEEYLEVFKCANGKSLFRFSISDLVANSGLNLTVHDDLYLNHVSWCPCNSKFVTLLHSEDSSKKIRKVYPFLIDIKSQNIVLLNNSGFFSHHIWLDQDTFFAYLEINGKRVWGTWTNNTGWQATLLSHNEDGHPTLVNSNSLVIDTYPNRLSKMNLKQYDLYSGKEIQLCGSLRNRSDFVGALRCDLHPRWSKTEHLIIDDPSETLRAVRLIRLQK